MDELIIRALEGRADREALEELQRWREAAEEHERRYQELRAVWTLSGLREEVDRSGEVPTAEDLLGRPAAGGGGDRPERSNARRAWRRRALRPALAAAAVLLVGIGLARFTGFPPGSASGDGSPAVAEFRTGPNELTTAALEDGSVVRLAPGTALEARMMGDEREVWLDGRAFFVVASDPDRPFRVRSEEGEVRVLGTRFEADTRRDAFRLLVLDGRVSLGGTGEVVELGAGQLGEAAGDNRPSVRVVEEPEALLDWMGAWMAFDDTPLHRVARELEIRLGIRIEIEDPAVADRTVSGWFAEEERDEMVSMICRVADLRCTVTNGRVRIEG